MTIKKSLNVALGEELMTYIDEQVRSGLFNNQSEVVRDALRQQRRGQSLDESLRRLNEMIEAGRQQVLRGQVVTAEASRQRLEAIIHGAEAKEAHETASQRANKRASGTAARTRKATR